MKNIDQQPRVKMHGQFVGIPIMGIFIFVTQIIAHRVLWSDYVAANVPPFYFAYYAYSFFSFVASFIGCLGFILTVTIIKRRHNPNAQKLLNDPGYLDQIKNLINDQKNDLYDSLIVIAGRKERDQHQKLDEAWVDEQVKFLYQKFKEDDKHMED